MVFEQIEQDLSTFLELCPPPGLPPTKVKDIMWQLLKVVDFLHSHRIIQLSYASSLDIWSGGCIFAGLLTRNPFFPCQNESDQLTQIFGVIGTPAESDCPEESHTFRSNFAYIQPRYLTGLIPDICDWGVDLLQKMLKFDKLKRISAQDALSHPYFVELATDHNLSLSTSTATDVSLSDASMNQSHDTSSSSL